MHISIPVLLAWALVLLQRTTALPVQNATALPAVADGVRLPSFESLGGGPQVSPVLLADDGHANGTSTLLIEKRDPNFQEVTIGCREDKCPTKKVKVDASYRASMTCPRRALAAKANYLEFCTEKRDGKCLTSNGTPRQPEITVCCSEWVYAADAYSMGYPTMRDPATGKEVPEKTGKELYQWPPRVDYAKSDQVFEDHPDWIFRKVIKLDAWEFNDGLRICNLWAPTTEAQFQFFMQNLGAWGIDEVAETEGSNMQHVGPPNDP